LIHPVRVTALAEADLSEAFRWYEAKKEDLGFEFLARVEEAVQTIARNPTSCARVIDDARRVLLKQFPYALWYRLEKDGSIVIACLHHKRRPALVKSRIRRKPEDR